MKRNQDRFPDDFAFQLTREEWDDLLCQSGISSSYIADIHAEVKGRPLYVVGELENFDGVPELPPRAVVARLRAPLPTAEADVADRPA